MTELKSLIAPVSAIVLGLLAAIVVAFPTQAQTIGVSLDANAQTAVDPDTSVSSDGSVGATTSVSSGRTGGSAAGNAGTLTVMRASLGGSGSAPAGSAAVATDADLSAYTTAVMKNDERIDAVAYTDESVEVTFVEPGRLLGLFPVSMKARATVAADGTVEVSYPWYRFLVASDTNTDVEASIASRVAAWQENSASAELTLAAKAALMDEVRAALDTSVSVR